MATTTGKVNHFKQQMPLCVVLPLFFSWPMTESDFCNASRRNSTSEWKSWLLQVAGYCSVTGFCTILIGFHGQLSLWHCSISGARPLQETHWSSRVSLELCTLPPPLPFPEELPGDAYKADSKLYKIYSVILLQRQTIAISAAHVGQGHTWECVSVTLPQWGSTSPARGEQNEQLTVQQLLGGSPGLSPALPNVWKWL